MNAAIEKALKRWIEADLLDESQASRIMEWEQQHKQKPEYEESAGRSSLIFKLIGLLFAAVGIVLLVAQNWENLSVNNQSILALSLPLFSAAYAARIYMLPDKAYGIFEKEATGMLFILSAAASVFIMSDIHQYQGSYSGYFTFLSLLAAFWLWFTGSRLGFLFAALCALALVWMHSVYKYELFGWSSGWIVIVFLSITLAGYQQKLLFGRDRICYATEWVLFLAVSISLPLAFAENKMVWFIYPAASLALMSSSFVWTKISGPNRIWKSPVYTVGLGLLLMCIFRLAFLKRETNLAELSLQWPGNVIIGVIIILAGALFYQRIISSNRFTYQAKLEIVWVLFATAITVLHLFSPIASLVLANILLLWIAAEMIARGIRKGDPLSLNTGLFLLFVASGRHLLESDWEIWVRGLAFLVAGALFVLLNKLIIQNRKNDIAERKPAYRFGEDLPSQ
ncbi:MAG: DUF2157 domain-containing protein [Balneolales bacterium]|nr:DUF2157 domain-containing protein [Balneolales bacterium]